MAIKLIDPVRLTIAKVDAAETFEDDLAREVVAARPEYTDPFVIPAQIYGFTHLHQARYASFGVDEQARLVATCRWIDARIAGYVPRRGDLLLKVGADECELYVTVVENMAHRGSHNGAGVFRLYLADRRPATAEPNQGPL